MTETQNTTEYYTPNPIDEPASIGYQTDVFKEVAAGSNEADGIEILVNMAKHGKVDPWNIDIVDITDKYLAQLFKMKAQNLRLTGRTLLFAAILLKLKSNILEGIDVNVQDNDGFTPLMHAISNRNDEIILMILMYSNVDLTMKNKDQMTAYDIAIAKGYYDIAIKLKVN